MVSRVVEPDFLDLPWSIPLADWTHERMATVARGISRHVVRFVRYDTRVFALKETEDRAAEHEYRTLRTLHDDLRLPTVEPVAVVNERRAGHHDAANGAGTDLGAVLITRFLDFSLPYRYLFSREDTEHYRSRLIDALVVLLVRLHLHGFEWGDLSLSNTLFRRDAGSLAAYLVDAETGTVRPGLTDAARAHDIELGKVNIVGGLMDLQAQGRLPVDVDPIAVVDDLGNRYGSLWSELTRIEELDPSERWRIDARIRRINDLGFDVEEISLERSADGSRLWLRPVVVEEGHHVRTLARLTGLEVQENQARRLLAAVRSYGAWLARDDDGDLPEAVVAYRWLAERFEPIVAAVPEELGDRLEPAELYHRFLGYRAEARGTGSDAWEERDDLDLLDGFVESVLVDLPGERQLPADED